MEKKRLLAIICLVGFVALLVNLMIFRVFLLQSFLVYVVILIYYIINIRKFTHTVSKKGIENKNDADSKKDDTDIKDGK